jgi:hypothetical protein
MNIQIKLASIIQNVDLEINKKVLMVELLETIF